MDVSITIEYKDFYRDRGKTAGKKHQIKVSINKTDEEAGVFVEFIGDTIVSNLLNCHVGLFILMFFLIGLRFPSVWIASSFLFNILLYICRFLY